MSQAASGSEKLTDGANQLVAGSQTLTTNLHSLADSSLTFSNGTEQFTKDYPLMSLVLNNFILA